MKQKMTRDTVPEGFTLGLALVDALPVLLFCGTMVLAGVLFSSPLFLLGAGLCLFAGAAKVLWKIIVVLQKKNIWWLFLQMRILMPVGLVLMLVGGFTAHADLHALWAQMTAFPAAPFLCAGIAGMVLMTVFAFTLDSSDARSNWIEQLTNGAAQLAFFLGFLMITLHR